MTAPIGEVDLSVVGFSRNVAVPAVYLQTLANQARRQGRGVFARRTTGRSIPVGSGLTVVPLEAETVDSNGGGMFDPLIGSYLTIVDPGGYLLLGQVPYPTTAAARFVSYVLKNGTTADSIIATGTPAMSIDTVEGPVAQVFGFGVFDQGDRIYLAARHTLGTAVTTSTDRGGAWLAAAYLGRTT